MKRKLAFWLLWRESYKNNFPSRFSEEGKKSFLVSVFRMDQARYLCI